MTISFDFLKFPFDDDNWISKFVIGGFLSTIGTMGWIFVLPMAALIPVYGYMIRIMRQTIHGHQPTLPAWDDWGELFRDGLKALMVYAIYFLPIILLLCVSYALLFIPLMIAGATGGDPEAALPATMVGYVTFFIGFACMMILILPLTFLSAASLTRMVAHDSVSAAFQFSEVWSLVRRGIGNYFMSFVLIFGILTFGYIAIYAAAYSFILLCIVPFLTAFVGIYLVVLMGATLGKAYYETEGPPPDRPVEALPDPDPDPEPTDDPGDSDSPEEEEEEEPDEPPTGSDKSDEKAKEEEPPDFDATLIDQPKASKSDD